MRLEEPSCHTIYALPLQSRRREEVRDETQKERSRDVERRLELERRRERRRSERGERVDAESRWPLQPRRTEEASTHVIDVERRPQLMSCMHEGSQVMGTRCHVRALK